MAPVVRASVQVATNTQHFSSCHCFSSEGATSQDGQFYRSLPVPVNVRYYVRQKCPTGGNDAVAYLSTRITFPNSAFFHEKLLCDQTSWTAMVSATSPLYFTLDDPSGGSIIYIRNVSNLTPSDSDSIEATNTSIPTMSRSHTHSPTSSRASATPSRTIIASATPSPTCSRTHASQTLGQTRTQTPTLIPGEPPHHDAVSILQEELGGTGGTVVSAGGGLASAASSMLLTGTSSQMSAPPPSCAHCDAGLPRTAPSTLRAWSIPCSRPWGPNRLRATL